MEVVEVFQEPSLYFEDAKMPSISFLTDSTMAPHFITGEPGIPAFTGNTRQGQIKSS
jgi:hypothetical protein